MQLISRHGIYWSLLGVTIWAFISFSTERPQAKKNNPDTCWIIIKSLMPGNPYLILLVSSYFIQRKKRLHAIYSLCLDRVGLTQRILDQNHYQITNKLFLYKIRPWIIPGKIIFFEHKKKEREGNPGKNNIFSSTALRETHGNWFFSFS